MNKPIKLIYNHFASPPQDIRYLINQTITINTKGDLCFDKQILDKELIKTFFIPSDSNWDNIFQSKDKSKKVDKTKEDIKETKEISNKEI
ncbi:hypothetical protein [Clostridium haemolyticum]|uniref:Uncharacterized protein n=1 Tax=Clostridium haemolyticum NCTC 9693 TaxID=1443114 RepID=A0ABR4TBG1_CLOHA|nr:hypothetical protein [Clostridium haemolyticum]KEI14154.1 hypothetical protein Z960_p0161 [Clostridium haemolyticum NCTC 9693]